MKRFIVYAAAALAVVIGTVEICAWVSREPSEVEREARFIRFDPELGWANRPSARGDFTSRSRGYAAQVSFDEQGFRRNGPSAAGAFNKTILVVGDSTTLGMEVSDEQAYPAVLERLFREHGQAVRVINAGVRGYGTDQTFLYLQRLLPQVRPDVVLFMAGVYGLKPLTTLKNWYRRYGKPAFALDGKGLALLNSPVRPMGDDELAYLAYHGDRYELIRKRVKAGGLSHWLREHSLLYGFVDDWYYRTFRSRDFIPPNDRNERIETFRRLLGEMAAATPRLVVTGFTMHDPRDVPDYDVYREAARERGLEFLDIRPAFQAGVLYKYPRDGHWNAAGHEQAARALYAFLAQHPALSAKGIAAK